MARKPKRFKSKVKFDLLIQDVELEKKGYKIFYWLDAYDVIEYCFPSKTNSSAGSVDLKLNALLGYNYILYEYPYNPILADEYVLELKGYWNHIKTQKENYSEIRNYFVRHLVDDFDNLKKSEFVSKLRSNLKTIALFQSQIISNDIVAKFKEIMEDRLMISRFHVPNITESKTIESFFKELEVSESAESIFDEFCDKIFDVIKYKDDADRFAYLENSYRDIASIDRMLTINKKLHESNFKCIFLYVSSAPIKTPIIFDLKEVKKRLPKINNKYYSVLRTKEDLYYKAITKSNDLDETVKLLQIYEKNQKGFERALNKSKRFNPVLQPYELSKDLEQDLLLRIQATKKFSESKKELNDYINDIEEINDQEKIKTLFKKINYFLIEEPPEISTELGIVAHHLSYNLNKNLLNILSVENIKIRSGKDIVVGTYQHLPILLFFDQKQSTSLQSVIESLTSFCVDYRQKDQLEFVDEISNYLKTYLDETPHSIERYLISNILKLFFLIISSGQSIEEKNNFYREETVLKDSLRLLKIYEKTYRSNKKLKTKSSSIELNIYYLIIWISRRILDFKNAIKYSKKAIKNTLKLGDHDPRMYHGLALAKISNFYFEKQTNNKSIIYLLEEAKDDIRSAKAYYQKVIENNEISKKQEEIILKTLSALDNTMADILPQIYINSELDENLELARKYLLEVKKREGKNVYEVFPEFHHTEADLEYVEAFKEYFKKKDIKESSRKIILAYNRINEAKLIKKYDATNLALSEKKISFFKVMIFAVQLRNSCDETNFMSESKQKEYKRLISQLNALDVDFNSISTSNNPFDILNDVISFLENTNEVLIRLYSDEFLIKN